MGISVAGLVRRYVDEVLNRGSLDLVQLVFGENYRDHDPLVDSRLDSRSSVMQFARVLALPTSDVCFTIEDLFEVSSRAAYRLFGEGSLSSDGLQGFGIATPTDEGAQSYHFQYSCTGMFYEKYGKLNERWGHALLEWG